MVALGCGCMTWKRANLGWLSGALVCTGTRVSDWEEGEREWPFGYIGG